MDKAAFDRTVQIATDGKVLTSRSTGTACRNDLAQKALSELGSSADTKGELGARPTVALTEGGK